LLAGLEEGEKGEDSGTSCAEKNGVQSRAYTGNPWKTDIRALERGQQEKVSKHRTKKDYKGESYRAFPGGHGRPRRAQGLEGRDASRSPNPNGAGISGIGTPTALGL